MTGTASTSKEPRRRAPARSFTTTLHDPTVLRMVRDSIRSAQAAVSQGEFDPRVLFEAYRPAAPKRPLRWIKDRTDPAP